MKPCNFPARRLRAAGETITPERLAGARAVRTKKRRSSRAAIAKAGA